MNRKIWFKNTSLEYDDGTHAIILNSRYRQEGNASESILEFLDYIRTDDALTDPSSELVKQVKKQVNAVRLDAELGVKYMTLEMKIRDERRWAERQATERLNKLITFLTEENRIDDLKRSAKDKAYQKKLLKEYNLL